MSNPNTAGLAKMLKALAGLPGSAEIDVYTRCLPRFWPAEDRSPYEEKTSSLTPQTIGQDPVKELVVVSNDPDEVVITIRGSIGSASPANDVKDATRQVFDALQLDSAWDLRMRVTCANPHDHRYELKLSSRFTAFPPC